MKKVFSLILAVAMVLSLASVAFAYNVATNDALDYITEKVKDVYCFGYVDQLQAYSSDNKAFSVAGQLTFGKTYYYPIVANYTAVAADTNGVANPGFAAAGEDDEVYRKVNYATFAKQVGSLSVSANWTEGGEYVAGVGIKPVFSYVDFTTTTNINRNVYCVYIETTGSSTEVESIVGELKVTGKAGSGAYANKVETTIPVDAKIYYKQDTFVADTAANTIKMTAVGTTTIKNVEYTADADYKSVIFNGDVKATIENSMNGKTYLVTFDSLEDAAITAANPDAAIMFYNITFNFRENAEIEIAPIDEEADNYLYQRLPNGTYVDLTSTYSEDDALFEFSARKLAGTYMVSDKPLVF